MKKITMIFLFVFGAFTISMAQTTSSSPASTMTTKQDKAALAAQKKADRQAKALAKKQAKAASSASATVSPSASATSTTHLNKNGTPDKRFKANKKTSAYTPSTPAPAVVPAQAPPATSVTTNRATNHMVRANTAKVADKSIGADAQGRTIYQGPRGGKYYINKNGNKEYVK